MLAIRGVNRPHQVHARRKTLEANVVAIDELHETGVTKGVLGVGASAESRVARDLPWPDDSDVVSIDCVNEARVTLNPAAFPPNLCNEVIVKFVGAEQIGALFQSQNRVATQRE